MLMKLLYQRKKFPFSVAKASPTFTTVVLTSPTITEEPNTVFTTHDNANILQTHSHHHFFSRAITRLKSQKAPKGEVHCVTFEEDHYFPKETFQISNSNKQKADEQGWE